MLQTIEGKDVYVVEFDTIPALPITWTIAEEKLYAKALDDAIRTGVIKEPGKYGIHITTRDRLRTNYDIYTLIEK